MCFSASCGQREPSAYQIQRGEIEGAKFTIAVPKKWSGCLLLLAHGLRPESAPLTADFAPEAPVFQHLLSEGWMIAATSYRRNGVIIIVEAVEDINRLQQHIVKTYGKPMRVLIDGSSMGGTIVTLIAETQPEEYDGVLAIGAALSLQDPHHPYLLTYVPRIPLLFLSNQNEVTGPREYVQKAGKASVLPALWYVARDGHVNVTHAEHEAAIRALIRYIETGRIKHSKDATIHPAVRESSAKFKDGGAYGKVTKIHPSYGNLNPEFIEADLKTLRLAPNSHFQVKFREKSFKVFLGTTYSDVPRGEWVAFLTAEGNLKIARNFANAAKALGCQSGDMIFIGPLTIRKESISKK